MAALGPEPAGQKRWWHWLREVEIRNAWFLVQALRRSQRMLEPRHYLDEHRLAPTPGFPTPDPTARWSRPPTLCQHGETHAG